jgi:hypothetical protein
MKRRLNHVIVAMSVGLAGGVVLAGTPPVTAPAGSVPAPAQPVSSYSSPVYSSPEIIDFPQSLAAQIPDAVARKTYARMMLWRATSDLSNTFTKMRFQFEHSPDQKQLIGQEQSAFIAYQSARNAALAKLATDEDYKAVVELRDELGRRITDLRKIKGITPDSIAPVAEEKLNYARTASAMEAKALAEDASVTATRDRFVAAGSQLAQARRDFDEQLHYHPAVEAARTNLADAKVAAATTASYSDTLINVGNAALRYAYFLHRHDQPAVIYSAYNNGYGYDRLTTNMPYRYYGYGYSR